MSTDDALFACIQS